MRSFRLPALLLIIIAGCGTPRHLPPDTTTSRAEYIDTYSEIAVKEMKRTGIPASIKMAQAILESGDGNSTLARRANNHFGIKCHDWTGRRIYHDDDERNECFRRYRSAEESFRDHSDFLTGRSRYAGLFELDPYDYEAWAKGLKSAGYATNPHYDRLLIRIIEENQLYLIDSGAERPPGRRRSETARHEEAPEAVAKSRIEVCNRIRCIIAGEGDTYESITREMDLMRWELLRYNDISPEHRIQPGDIIYLQPKRRRAERGNDKHLVNEGETMWYISQKYGVRLDRLLRRNHMQDGDEPSPGDTIYLRNEKPAGEERPVMHFDP